MQDGRTFTAFLWEGSELHTEHTFSSEVISDLDCSSGTYQNGIQLTPPGVAYLYNNEESFIGTTSSCRIRNDNTPYEGPPSNNFIRIISGTCESNGYNELISHHECALAIEGEDTQALLLLQTSLMLACYEYVDEGSSIINYWYNSNLNSTVTVSPQTSGFNGKWCKQ